MSGFKKLLARLGVAIQILVLSSGLGLTAMATHVSAESTAAVTGMVTDSQGDGLNRVTVEAFKPGTDTVVDRSPTAADYPDRAGVAGTYELTLPLGVYDIKFDASNDPNWSHAIINLSSVNITGPTTLNEQLTPDNSFQVAGNITTENGQVLPAQAVTLVPSGGGFITISTNANGSGAYTLHVPENSYSLQVTNNSVLSNLPQAYVYSDSLTVAGSMVHDEVLPHVSMVTVQSHFPRGLCHGGYTPEGSLRGTVGSPQMPLYCSVCQSPKVITVRTTPITTSSSR